MFSINIAILIHYYGMGQFFTNMLQENATHGRNFKIAMFIFMASIIISNLTENLYFPVHALIYFWMEDGFSIESQQYFFTSVRILNFLR